MQTTTWILDFPKYTVETLLSVGKYCAILNIHGISLFSRAAIIIRDIFLPLRATRAFNASMRIYSWNTILGKLTLPSSTRVNKCTNTSIDSEEFGPVSVR